MRLFPSCMRSLILPSSSLTAVLSSSSLASSSFSADSSVSVRAFICPSSVLISWITALYLFSAASNESCSFFALPRISFIFVSASLRFLNLSPAASSVACSLSETTFAVSADIFLSSSASFTCIPANASSS